MNMTTHYSRLEMHIIIRLEARLQANIGNTLRPILMLFTHSGIALPKVNLYE